MSIQKILLVDDSKTELHHLSDVLGKRGYQVRTAENADEAMRRLSEDKPDLILMDVVMPGQNGFQLTRTITRDPRWSTVPVIMCTSKNQETDKVWGMRQGARDYIVKPVNTEELVDQDQGLRLTRAPNMANREALRELQGRLATRMQAARTEAPVQVLAGGGMRRAGAAVSAARSGRDLRRRHRPAGATHAAMVHRRRQPARRSARGGGPGPVPGPRARPPRRRMACAMAPGCWH